jgi:hypothetical protein
LKEIATLIDSYVTEGMTGKLSIIFAVFGFVVIIGTEVLRSFMHRRREQTQGIGGTQDIAMYGTFLGLAFFVCAAICLLLWKFAH